jgi:hypothetical protein
MMEYSRRTRPIEISTDGPIIATAELFGIRLVFRRGIGERGKGHTSSFNCQQLWVRGQIDTKAARIGELWHEAEIGHSRCFAEAKISLFGYRDYQLFQR